MEKKGSALFASVSWIWKIPAVVVVAVFVFIVVNAYVTEEFETRSMEDVILSTSLRYSPQCLASENAESVEVNTIDLKKVESLRLTNCYQKQNLAYRIRITSLEGDTLASASTIPLNLEKLIPVCESVPDYACSTRNEFVLITHEQGEAIPAIMNLEVVRRVS